MQQERDDLDSFINNSIDKIIISSNYNEKLISKINQKEADKTENKHLYKNSAAALSLILSGLLFILISTTNINNTINMINCRIKTQFLAAEYEYNYKMETIKNNIGDGY